MADKLDRSCQTLSATKNPTDAATNAQSAAAMRGSAGAAIRPSNPREAIATYTRSARS